MKVAIPCISGEGLKATISDDYSDCTYFVIADACCSKIDGVTVLERILPPSVEQMSGALSFLLAGKGVQAVLINNISEVERLSLLGNGIKVYTGASGNADSVLKQYLSGKLTEKSEMEKCSCSSHNQ